MIDQTPSLTDQNRSSKANLRRRLLKARQSIPPQVWREKCDRICTHLLNWDYFRQCRVILAYTSFRNEPDLSPLANHHLHWGLPRCVGKEMHWHYWSIHSEWPLQKGAYNITEPHPQSPPVDLSLVDLILVPAVACDVRGHRLGYGGGFYDRMLSKTMWRRVPTVAVVFEYARLPAVPKDVWDRPMHGVCTESGLFLAKQR